MRADGKSERALFVIDKAGKVAFIDVHEILDVPDNEDLYEVLATLK
jgi:peroxiredoxin